MHYKVATVHIEINIPCYIYSAVEFCESLILSGRQANQLTFKRNFRKKKIAFQKLRLHVHWFGCLPVKRNFRKTQVKCLKTESIGSAG